MGKSREAIHKAAHEAKEFLIGKINLEAELDGIPLTEIERKMLYFSEVEQEPPDLFEVNDQFEKECDSQEYEAKIAGLIKKAYGRDRAVSRDNVRRWFDEITALSKEDHYILVMVGQAHLRKPGDTLRLLGAGIAIVAAIAGFGIFAAKENLSDPEIKFGLVVLAIVILAIWVIGSPRRRAVAGVSLRMLLPTSAFRRTQARDDGPRQTKSQ